VFGAREAHSAERHTIARCLRGYVCVKAELGGGLVDGLSGCSASKGSEAC
jgi:hypothetical protein